MNAASIAMAASLFNDKPNAPPVKSKQSPVLVSTTKKTSSIHFEDELPEDSVSSTVLVSDDKPEDFNNDDDHSFGDDENINSNGTGLIMYVTTTATKAPYWKRRLGWKPNMARAQRQKLKNLFRAPIRKQATLGLSQKASGDALLLTKARQDSNQLQSSVGNSELVVPARKLSSCKREWDPNEDYVMDNDDDETKDKEWQAFRAINHDLVFA